MTRSFVLITTMAGLAIAAGSAQDRLKDVAGYEQAQRFAREAPTFVRGGALSVSWRDDGNAFEFTRNGRRYQYEVDSRHESEILSPPDTPPRPPAGAPERGRQDESATSPDGSMTAFYRDRNVWLSAAGGTGERAVTTDGSAASRIKYGTASWVYGEELSQRTAMWWSPDSRKLAFYRFDEARVLDYYVTLDQTKRQSTVDAEAFPMAGGPNPLRA